MALFVKRPIAIDSIPLYTTSTSKTILIIGLGNIGKKYDNTRHNIGFACLDHFAKVQDFPAWIEKKDLKSQLTMHTLGDVRVILAKPTTYMNSSGEAAQALQRFYKINNSQTIVVHDEIDIAFGLIRTRLGGGSAGHNGLNSAIQHINENFARIRIGIGPKIPSEIDSADFVLSKFSKKEQENISGLLAEVSSLLTELIYGDGQLPHETRSFIV